MNHNLSLSAGSFLALCSLCLIGCNSSHQQPDAYGNFETNEVIISAQSAGTIVALKVNEGQWLNEGDTLGQVDDRQLQLQKKQLEATLVALAEKRPDIGAQTASYDRQIAVQKEQLASLERDLARAKALVKAGAAPEKQWEDLNAQHTVLKKQIALTEQQRESQVSALRTQSNGLVAEEGPLHQQIKIIEDQLKQTYITSPLKGMVVVKYAEQGEVISFGKPICSIAKMDTLLLRAYVPGDKLSQLKVGEKVRVAIDTAKGELSFRLGEVRWVSPQAEFTPKIIQTREERVNLVYAFTVAVPNDGELKIGMPGEVYLNQ